jgi:hypothetical protein
VPCCRCLFWIPIFDFCLHFAAAAPNGPPVPPKSPRSPTENCGLDETERLGVLWKDGVHQGDDDHDREDEDKKVHDDIELTCIK